MAELHLEHISKRYGEARALNDFSLHIRDKEFLVLFGPAGAGKTTLLSIISGIIDCDEGIVSFDGKAMDPDIAPSMRNVAMVFEDYALYPHFSVYDNIAFPLRSAQYKKSEKDIRQAVEAVTKKMNIGHLLDRLPSQMSNGQRQRVALGRALVRNPNVFLMDEPLAHLDAKLKNFMRTELKSIQQQLDTTAIYVTHDYLEALSLGDRIAIIDKGSLVQVGDADAIYSHPCNTFVASLVGEPEINLYHCVLKEKSIVSRESPKFRIPLQTTQRKLLEGHEDAVIVGIRGIYIASSFQKQAGWQEGQITDFHSTGNRFVVQISFSGVQINTLLPGDSMPQIGKKLFFKIDTSKLLFFRSTDTTAIQEN